MTGPTITIPVHFEAGRRGSRVARAGSPKPKPKVAKGRVPRVTRLMALAIRMDELVRSGTAKDYAELARATNVSRARISQIANLTLLAPDIQEAILDLPLVERGRNPISERILRPIIAEPSWTLQREMWVLHTIPFNDIQGESIRKITCRRAVSSTETYRGDGSGCT